MRPLKVDDKLYISPPYRKSVQRALAIFSKTEHWGFVYEPMEYQDSHKQYREQSSRHDYIQQKSRVFSVRFQQRLHPIVHDAINQLKVKDERINHSCICNSKRTFNQFPQSLLYSQRQLTRYSSFYLLTAVCKEYQNFFGCHCRIMINTGTGETTVTTPKEWKNHKEWLAREFSKDNHTAWEKQ